ncbi:hypothetical protein NL676_033246 [Syzygium grande]|nr:hypothetical protein NL676_033246 [Syzygium grande]
MHPCCGLMAPPTPPPLRLLRFSHPLLSSPTNLPLHASTLSSSVHTPLCHSHPLSAAAAPSASLLLMPSWTSHPSLSCIGIKLMTHFQPTPPFELRGVPPSLSSSAPSLASPSSLRTPPC